MMTEANTEAMRDLHAAIGENVLTYAAVDSHLISFITGFSGNSFMAGFLIEKSTALASKFDVAERLMNYKIKMAPPSARDAKVIDENLKKSFKKFAEKFRLLSKTRNVLAHGCIITEPNGLSYISYSPMMPRSSVAEMLGGTAERLTLDDIRKNTASCRDLLGRFRLLLEILHTDEYRNGNRKGLEAIYGPLDQLTVLGHQQRSPNWTFRA